ncbi:MAG: tetratricopeptide repeat protein, partial [Aquabacterium sp.]|nr:tetratricopeptide repeat protein [Aquabacterium sp.]
MPPRPLLLATAALLTALALSGCGKPEAQAIAKVRDRAASVDPATARKDLRNLVQAHPKSGEARLLLGQRMLDDGDGAAAAIELQRALEYGAAEHQALPVLVEALLQSGQYGRATQGYNQANLAPTDANAHARLMAAVAGAEMALGNGSGARTAVDSALQAAPQAPQALLAKARLAAIDGDLPGALAVVDAVVASHPTLVDAWVLKGDLHLRQDDNRANAQGAFDRAVALRATLVAPRMALMSLHVAQGDLPAAQAQLAALKQLAPKNINTTMAEGQLAFVAGEHARARDIFQGLLRVLPDNATLLLTAGENELVLGSAQQAEAHFAKVVALAPGNAVARRQLARAQVQLGQLPKALATLAPLVDRADAPADVLAMAAGARMLNNEPRAAQALYDRLARLKPT